MVATTPNSISRSASSCIVQHSRPSGGALQASAIRNASCLVSSLRWAPGRGRSVSAACSPSSAKRLRMLRTVWGLTLRVSAMAGSVLPSSERRRMRARVRVRALACPLRSRVLRSLRSSSFSRTTSCFCLLVVWFVRAKCHGERIPHKKQSGQVVDNRAGSERLIAWVGRSHTNRAGGVYNCPPPAGSPRFARGTESAPAWFPLRAGGTLRSKGIEKSSPAYSDTRSYALPSRTIAFNTTNN
jgi:hypothetical protein